MFAKDVAYRKDDSQLSKVASCYVSSNYFLNNFSKEL